MSSLPVSREPDATPLIYAPKSGTGFSVLVGEVSHPASDAADVSPDILLLLVAVDARRELELL